MKKMHNVDKEQFNKDKTIKFKIPKSKANTLHYLACLENNTWISKDKTKIIPRKQKYRKLEWDK